MIINEIIISMYNIMSVELCLSHPQVLKITKGKPLQMSAAQISSGEGIHRVRVDFNHKKHYNRLLRNVANQKGFRFDPKHIEGVGLWDSAKKLWSKVAPFVRKV